VSTVDTVKAVARHRKLSWLGLAALAGVQGKELNTLRPRVAELEAALDNAAFRLDGALLLAGGLRLQLDEAHDIRDDINAKAVRYDEAEHRATAAEQQLAAKDEELIALRQFKANVQSVDVTQLGHRDIDPGDAVTVPVPIVKTLAEAFGQGRASTDPARTTWGRRNEQAGVA